MATLWVMVGHAPSSSRQYHHHYVRNGRAHVNTKTSDNDHNQTLTKRRRRRKKDSGRYSYNNHIINDKYDDDDHIKIDSNEEWHKANKMFRNYTSTNRQNMTLWIFHVRGSNRTTENYNQIYDDGISNEVINFFLSNTLRYHFTF
jgi:hypothetical protein